MNGLGADRQVDPKLVDDPASFVDEVAAGGYVDEWGYDPDYRDHRAFGDELWTIEMADLFHRADTAFLAGDVALARDAYRGLLEALAADFGGEASFPGASTPEELLSTDADEATLRCVEEVEPAATHAAGRVDAARTLLSATTDQGGWSGRFHPGPVVVPVSSSPSAARRATPVAGSAAGRAARRDQLDRLAVRPLIAPRRRNATSTVCMLASRGILRSARSCAAVTGSPLLR
jgi:hypothetical protein